VNVCSRLPAQVSSGPGCTKGHAVFLVRAAHDEEPVDFEKLVALRCQGEFGAVAIGLADLPEGLQRLSSIGRRQRPDEQANRVTWAESRSAKLERAAHVCGSPRLCCLTTDHWAGSRESIIPRSFRQREQARRVGRSGITSRVHRQGHVRGTGLARAARLTGAPSVALVGADHLSPSPPRGNPPDSVVTMGTVEPKRFSPTTARSHHARNRANSSACSCPRRRRASGA